MAERAYHYPKAMAKFLAGQINWTSDTLKIMLVNSTYDFANYTTHEFRTSATSAEIAGTGYVSGGQTLTGKAAAYNAVDLSYDYDAADPSWAGLVGTPRYAIIYKVVGSAATDPLLVVLDFGTVQNCTGLSPFEIYFDATGVLRVW